VIRCSFRCALALLSLAACKTTERGTGPAAGGRRDARAEAKPVVTTPSDAQTTLAKGNEALEGKSYADAERYFEHVRDKYPFLDAAKEAELRLADLEFERDRMTEARDRYNNFVKLHPTHPKVDYAAFRSAMTHYKEMPSEFFILPPSHEKDQIEVRAANKSMTDFVRSYPNSPYLTEAKKVVDQTRRRLAKHELYVADFYEKRGKWNAVAGRLENVVGQFSGLGYDEPALFRLHDVYTKLNDSTRAQDALRRIITRFPNTPAAARAQQMLGS
jgi:outer membrane protein assembly factor BamD